MQEVATEYAIANIKKLHYAHPLPLIMSCTSSNNARLFSNYVLY